MQVLLVHAGHHLGVSIPGFIEHFPGVPAFFFVSGFLIYASYHNSPGFRYFQNRALRIFPGLIFVTFGSFSLVVFLKGLPFIQLHAFECVVWFLAQITIGQFYNPAIFKDIGVGVINGALWTITTEILFYFIIPIIVVIEKRLKHIALLLTIFSFTIYAFGPSIFTQFVYREKTIYDIFAITPIAWGWMFGIGILSCKYFDHIKKFTPFLFCAAFPMIGFILIGDGILLNPSGNRLGILYFLCYVSVLLWVAFSLPAIKMNFDLSYGLYIWHMPVINFLICISLKNFLMAAVLTLFLSIISWYLVERPFLKLKRKSLR